MPPVVDVADADADADSSQAPGPCPVCLETPSAAKTATLISCAMVYHMDCVTSWFATHAASRVAHEGNIAVNERGGAAVFTWPLCKEACSHILLSTSLPSEDPKLFAVLGGVQERRQATLEVPPAPPLLKALCRHRCIAEGA